MKKIPAFRETNIRRATRTLVVSLLSSSLTVAQASVNLGTAPPVAKQAPEPVPNIILTLDNSGSMSDKDGGTTTRMERLKNAVHAAFSNYQNGEFRLAYQTINSAVSASGLNAYGFKENETRNLMKPFKGKHRQDFLDWAAGLGQSGGTPLRASTIRAGNYAMGYFDSSRWEYSPEYGCYIDARTGQRRCSRARISVPVLRRDKNDRYTYDGKQYRYDPLNGLECRRSIHVLMTDGEWGGDEYLEANDNGALYVQRAVSFKTFDSPPAAISIPQSFSASPGVGTSTVAYSTTIAQANSGNLYRDDYNVPTLADLSFNYWATDLRSDLDNKVSPKIKQKGAETFSWNGVNKTVPEWWNPKNNPATWQNMQTYTIGFGPVSQLTELRRPDRTYETDPNKYMYESNFFKQKITGSTIWNRAIYYNTATRYDLWHAAYNGRGKFYAASTADALANAFKEILAAAIEPAKAAATVNANASSSRLASGSLVYAASYEIVDGVWTGSLVYQKVGDYGTTNASNLAAANVPAGNARSIITWRNGVGGIPFRWENISSGLSETTIPKLSELNLGNNADKVNTLRSKPLGDIVNSSVALVGAPTNISLASSYREFAKAVASRAHTVYVGANDGMLHGFDAGKATIENPGSGVEKLAYVPRGLVRDLHKYLEKDYEHRYWVDGSPVVADMQIAAAAGESGVGKYNGWRTVLTGTLGAGGKGYYVLDVTDPAKFSESNASNIVLLDKTFAANDAAADPDLGYQIHEPVEDMSSLTRSGQVVQINLDSTVNPGQKQWAVIMGNGINSTNGKPVLLVQTLEGSSKTLYKVDACASNTMNCEAMPAIGAGTNGLLAPRPVDMNGDGTADVVYAGDFQGNMWKFDISSSSATAWKVGLGGKPLFTAKGLPERTANDPITAYRQTITAAPIVQAHPKGGFMVAFGTGRNINLSDQRDHNAENLALYGKRLNTFYAIHDTQKFGVTTQEKTIGGKKIKQQIVSLDAATAEPVDSTVQAGLGSRFASLFARSGGNLGAVSAENIRLGGSDSNAMSANSKGWYFDMPAVQFDNATKVLRNPWMMRDNIISFFSTNVSSESGSTESTTNEEEGESCEASTDYSPAIVQQNYFDLFSGENPNIAVHSNGNVINATSNGQHANIIQVDGGGGAPVKGSTSSIPGRGVQLTPRFSNPPGKFTGWRIVR